MPRPARLVSLTERRLRASVAAAIRRSSPAVTSSQRQTTVSSASQPVQPGRMPCAASIRRGETAQPGEPAAGRAQRRLGRVGAGRECAGERALGAGQVGAADAGDLAGGEDAAHAGPLVVVDRDEPVGQRAAGGDREFQARGEAVADADRVDLDAALGAGNRAPVGRRAWRR